MENIEELIKENNKLITEIYNDYGFDVKHLTDYVELYITIDNFKIISENKELLKKYNYLKKGDKMPTVEELDDIITRIRLYDDNEELFRKYSYFTNDAKMLNIEELNNIIKRIRLYDDNKELLENYNIFKKGDRIQIPIEKELYAIIKHVKLREANEGLPEKINVYIVYNETYEHYSLKDKPHLVDILKNNVSYNVKFMSMHELYANTYEIDIKMKNIFVFLADIYNYTEKTIDKRIEIIEQLKQSGKIIPDADFFYNIGSKRYVLDKIFRDYMLPGTMVYENNLEEIKKLMEAKTEYIFKPGYSSSGKNVSSCYIFNIHDRISQLTTGNIAIIQKTTMLYKWCIEFKFIILEDKIICINFSGPLDKTINFLINTYRNRNPEKKEIIKKIMDIENTTMTKTKKLYTINQHTTTISLQQIDSKIIEYVNNIIQLIKSRWPDYFYARIDIIIDCGIGRDAIDILFNLGDRKIYLNEIEPLGSGMRSECILCDDEHNIQLSNNHDEHDKIMEKIKLSLTEKITNIVFETEKIKEQEGGIKQSNIIKYMKNKHNYLLIKKIFV